MYRKKNRELQKENITISLEELVPKNHLLRIIDKAIDFKSPYFRLHESEKIGIEKTQILFVFHVFFTRAKFQVLFNFNWKGLCLQSGYACVLIVGKAQNVDRYLAFCTEG